MRPAPSRPYYLAMAKKTHWWRRFDPANVQEMVTESNDGIIAIAGMALGLIGAEVQTRTAITVITISIVAGALSIFGVKLGQNYAQRESQLATLREEQRLLETSPQEEAEALAHWFETRGVSRNTAVLVATELSEKNALAAQLELEYGIKEVASVRRVWKLSTLSAVFFVLGAFIPLAIAYFAPVAWHDKYTVLAAVVALFLTSVMLAWFGRSKFWPTVFRTLAVGITTLSVTYFLGDWLI